LGLEQRLTVPSWDATGDSQQGTAMLRDRMEDVLSDLHAGFSGISGMLESAVDSIATVISSLQQVTAAFGQGEAVGAVSNLKLAARRLLCVAQQVDYRGGQVQLIRQSTRQMGAQVEDVRKALEVLRIYGINVKITAFGREEFVDFANLMAEKLVAGKESAAGFDSQIAALESSLARMELSDGRLARECARVVPEVPDRLVHDAGALQGHQQKLLDMAQTTGELANAIQHKIASILSAIQIDDIARQRMEHVLYGCQLLDDYAPRMANPVTQQAVRHHVLRLLEAQMRETAQDYEREARVLVGSLRAMEPDAMRLVSLQQAKGGEDSGGLFLRRMESGIAEATAMIAQLQEADRQAEETLSMIISTVDDLAERAESIRNLRIDVQLMAINIGLQCRRVEAIGRPMTVVANEIRSYSEKLDTSIGAITAAAEQLNTASERLREQAQQDKGDTGDELAQSLATIRDGAMRTEEAMAAAGQRSHGISDLLRRTRDQMEANVGLGQVIASTSVMLAEQAGDPAALDEAAEAVLHELLPNLGRSYTMASERVVHDRFLLPGMAPISSGSASVTRFDDDDDDALFDDALF
jgi:hypothetical protein